MRVREYVLAMRERVRVQGHVCVCMCVCERIRAYTCVCARMYEYVRICVRVSLSVCRYVMCTYQSLGQRLKVFNPLTQTGLMIRKL